MPYLSQLDLTRARPAYSGLGQGPTGDPRSGTAAEWEAYYSRISWRRQEALTGPRGGEWARQAAWAAQALQALIEGQPVAVRPFPTDPELLALIVNGRSWLLTLPEWELNDLFPGLTPSILARARRILLPGRDVLRIAHAKLVADADTLAKNHARMVVLRAELQRYLSFAQDTMAQFQTYVRWFEHHQKKKEKRTQVVSAALTAVSTVLYWVPVVGWALGALVDAANLAFQLDRMKGAIEAMQAAGMRVEGARLYVAVMEALGQAIAEVEWARDESLWMLEFTREQIAVLDAIGRPAAEGAPQPTGVAPPGVASSAAASDASIVGALRAEVGKAMRAIPGGGKLLAVAGVAALALMALFGRRRRA